jgi:hypothetical protein
MLRPHLHELSAEMTQALPIRRLVLHYRFGAPALGRSRMLVRLLDAAEAASARLLPRSRWSYMVFAGWKPGHG